MNPGSNVPEPVVMTIAAFDPSGGAGIVADLKTFAAHGYYGVAAMTAISVRNEGEVDDVHPVEAQVLQACLRSLLADTRVKAIKIGMLATCAAAHAVLETLEANPSLPVALDPLVRSAIGRDLIDGRGLEFVRHRLLPRATVITPNLADAAALTGLKVENLEGMKQVAHRLIEMGSRAVVVTGGRLERPVDVFAHGSSVQTLAGDPLKRVNIHGAGCTFSSALAANLGQGHQLAEAVVLAKAYVTEAIKNAYTIGAGRMPLNHFYRMREAHRPPDHLAAAVDPGVS